MKKRIQILLFSLIISLTAYGQIGGKAVYTFLDIPNSARLAGLSCNLISVRDGDINTAVYNPALINPSLNSHIGFSFLDYFAGIKAGYTAYAHTFKKAGTFTGAIHYFHYGRFVETNAIGQTIGEFFGYDYAMNIGWAVPIDKDSLLTFGSNLKFIYSWLETYTSMGVGCDIALNYYNRHSGFGASLLVRNLGGSIIPYNVGMNEPMLPDIQLGISQKLKHAPFRFTLNAVHLETPVLKEISDIPQIDPLTKDTIPVDHLGNFLDNFARHFLVGVEFVPTPAFTARIGYNYRRGQEMMLDDAKGLVGFSWGLGIKISKFQISYSRASYHLAGSSDHITITTRLSDFF